MKRGTTLILKVTLFLIGIPILAACIFLLPLITNEFSGYFPVQWVYSAIIGIYLSAVPYFIALYQAFKLLNLIDKNEAFSELSVRALKTIRNCAFTVCALFVAITPFLFFMAELDDAPGILALGLIIIFASVVIAVFAAVLQKLLQQAIDIKSENDLTV